MPIPKPAENESHDDFLSRCMGDSTMNSEYPDSSQRAAVCNAQFSSVDAGMSVAQLFRKVRTLDAEIFAVGKWNGYNITLRDLEDIVSAFDSLRDYHKVPLKFGHNDQQPMTDGHPALGWVNKLWVDYEQRPAKLMARFSDVPEPVYDAMAKKLYRKVSVELEFGVSHKGKDYSTVLSGVALLGADLPAVNVLADLDAYMTAKNPRSSFAHKSQAVFTINSNFKEAGNMPLTDEEERKLRADAAKAADLERENQKLKADSAEFERKEKERKENERKDKLKMARKSIDEYGEEMVTKKVWTPAQREAFRKMTHYEDDDKVLDADIDAIKAMFKTDDKKVDSKNDATSDAGSNDGDEHVPENPTQELIKLTRQRQEKFPKEDFQTASFAVMRDNPELAKAHSTDKVVEG